MRANWWSLWKTCCALIPTPAPLKPLFAYYHLYAAHKLHFSFFPGAFHGLCVLKEARCEQQLHGFLHMFLPCVLSLVCSLRSHRPALDLPPRLSKQARADWQAPARWRHPFIGALTPVSLAPLGRSPWRRQTRELALRSFSGSPAWRADSEPWEQTGPGALSFIYHLKAAGWDYRPPHLQSRRCQPVNSAEEELEQGKEEEGSVLFC